ncbi:MAG: alanine acetyltransferase [Actinobacteria bacterium HGW-Actinobacteria-2]|nr:MAG: alanine acetyltransferase [Actinobacteria bacterium HGW-Actinobacteria-2]
MTPVLRPLTLDDAERLAELFVTNREFLAPWEPVRPEWFYSANGQRRVVADSLDQQQEGRMFCQVILDPCGEVAGRINLNNIVRGPFQSASVGYWLAEAAGGRGLGTAAVAAMVELAFGELRLHRLEAGTIPENYRSQAVLRKNGFVQFGYAPAYLQIAGRYTDHLLFQRLADETQS